MKTAEEYVDLPYHFCLLPDEHREGNRGWFVRFPELDGCMSQGQTPDDAIEKARDAMPGCISVSLEGGQDIPLPFPGNHGAVAGEVSASAPASS